MMGGEFLRKKQAYVGYPAGGEGFRIGHDFLRIGQMYIIGLPWLQSHSFVTKPPPQSRYDMALQITR